MALVKSKTVSFNVESQDEKALLDWATNQAQPFSQYIKSLIHLHMTQMKRSPINGQGMKIRKEP